MSPADLPKRPAATTDGTPSGDPSPATTADGTRTVVAPPPTPPDDDCVELGEGATILQVGPPPAAISSPNLAASGKEQSGRVVRQLDRLIDRSRDAGAVDLAEGYKLLDSIGTGAFGSVWAAEDLETGEHVAIKFFAAGDEQWGKMLDEVRVLQSVEGAHGIVMVKQVRRGGLGRPPYYVMQLANRGSLAEKVEKARAANPPGPDGTRTKPLLPADEAVRIFTRITVALAAVHRRGILHCDLKPRNVLLHNPDPDGPDDPLVADFGQAHLATDDTPALGTFFFMPPDQAAAALTKALPDTRWDVYALGAVLYEMVTGDTPRRHGELIAKLKDTEHLDTKLRAYQDGIAAAPLPTAHRRLVDPLLAGIIDRCLELDPAKRPRSAGQVLELLRHREWWRQNRPVIALGVVGTFLLVVLLVGVGLFMANRVYADTERGVSGDNAGNLARTGWFGRPVVEDRLDKHVTFAEREANRAPPEVAEALTRAAAKYRETKYDPAAVEGRDAAGKWLDALHAKMRKWGPDEATALALMVVVPAADGNARGYHLARRHPTGDPDDARAWADDFSYRDYFNGTGDRHGTRGRPHPVLRHTHISQTYRSLGEDHQEDGTNERWPWRVDVATPVWSGPDRTGAVIGLLLVRLNVHRQLVRHLEVPATELPAHSRASNEVRVVLVDDRQFWVWHEDAMALRTAAGSADGPDNFIDLASRKALDGVPDLARHCPWADPDRTTRSVSYVDPVQWTSNGDGKAEFARWEELYPYRRSEYPAVKERRWVLVVQIDQETALEPLAVLRYNMSIAGFVVVAALAGLAAGLWGWLIRVLRGREFVTHG